jgi:transposase
MDIKNFSIDREELYRLYWIEKVPIKEIAERFNVSYYVVNRWLKKFNIPRRRTFSEEHRKKIGQASRKFKCSRDELYDLYWVQKLPVKDIAKKYGVAPITVLTWIKAYQIPLRGRVWNDQQRKRQSEAKTKFKVTKEELFNLYVIEQKSTTEIARIFGVGAETVRKRLEEYGIQRRSRSERMKILFSNLEYQEKFRQAMKEAFSRDEIKQKLCERSKRMWQNVDFKERMKQERKRRWSNIVYKKKMSEIRKLIWKDLSYREKIRKSLSERKKQKQNYVLKEERKHLQYRLWREVVLQKDCYICQKCGSSKNLQAHHIYNIADYPELRYAIDNGITLCKRCHEEFHKQFGWRKNTKVQLEAFLRGWQILGGSQVNEICNG